MSKTDELVENMQIKKRGRPKKYVHPQQPIIKPQKTIMKQSFEEIENEQEDNSIIVQLKLWSDDTSDTSQKNLFTMQDDNVKDNNNNSESDNNNDNDNDNDEIKEEDDKKLIMYLSDDDYKPNNDVQSLLREIKKKDEIIKKLKLDSTKNIYRPESISRNIDIKLLNMKLINMNRDKTIFEKTNIACWWCTYNFDNTPCFIPDRYNNGKYYVFGCFCSYNCALAYILKDDEYKKNLRISLIKKLYIELYGKDDDLLPSHPKEILQKFGGEKTIDEYRNPKNLSIKEYKFIIPSIIQMQCHFEEKYKEQNVIIKK